MKFYKGPFSAKHLRSVLRYEPETGHWFWLNPHYKCIKPGTRTALPDKTGRCDICYAGHQYSASRLAWLYMTGRWPTKMIDHKDGDTTNEKWNNLRQATNRQNTANRKINYRSTTGFKGVTKPRKKFIAMLAGKYLGSFETAEEASAVYFQAAKRKYGEYARV